MKKIIFLNMLICSALLFFHKNVYSCSKINLPYANIYTEEYYKIKTSDWLATGKLIQSEKPISDRSGSTCIPTTWKVKIKLEKAIKGNPDLKEISAIVYSDKYASEALITGKNYLVVGNGKLILAQELYDSDNLETQFLTKLITADFKEKPVNTVSSILKTILNKKAEAVMSCYKLTKGSDISSCINGKTDLYKTDLDDSYSYIMWSEKNIKKLQQYCMKIQKFSKNDVLEICTSNLVYRVACENEKAAQNICKGFKTISASHCKSLIELAPKKFCADIKNNL